MLRGLPKADDVVLGVTYRVTVWEPVPHFRAFLQYGLQLNDLLASVDVRAAVVAPNAGEQYEVIVPQQGIWGTAGIGGANIDP